MTKPFSESVNSPYVKRSCSPLIVTLTSLCGPTFLRQGLWTLLTVQRKRLHKAVNTSDDDNDTKT